jgi:sphinganine-1-phosphate aldolase
MGRAKLDIENKLVPKGADVNRHLALPAEGKPLEWILEQMNVMDSELGPQVNYAQGKLSGAVYRT